MAGIAFIIPPNPGIYPAGLAANAVAGTRARAEAEHKEEVAQYEILKGVEQALKDINLEAVENDYFMEIEDDTLRFLNQTPRQMINHLKAKGGALDFADTKLFLQKETRNGISAKTPKCISTESKGQSKHSPEHVLLPTSMNAGTWHCIISKPQANSMWRCTNGKTNQQRIKHGSTSNFHCNGICSRK